MKFELLFGWKQPASGNYRKRLKIFEFKRQDRAKAEKFVILLPAEPALSHSPPLRPRSRIVCLKKTIISRASPIRKLQVFPARLVLDVRPLKIRNFHRAAKKCVRVYFE
jgi:hypothetical protein